MRASNALFQTDNLEKGEALLSTLDRLAAAHQARPAQVALAWVVHHPNVVAIPGASSVAQVESNAEAADLELSNEEVAELDAVSGAFDPETGPAAVIKARLRR